MRRMPLVVHVITGLGNGGAEGALYRLCANSTNFRHHVVSLSDKGVYADRLASLGVEVTTIGMTRKIPRISQLLRLWRTIRGLRADVVQTWMYHADLLGGTIARFAGVRRIYWNVRHTSLRRSSMKASTIFVAKICAYLSRFIPAKVVFCANASKASHLEFGYDANRAIVIQNGYETNKDVSMLGSGARLRASLRLPEDAIIFGMVARIDSNKDHRSLIEAFARLRSNHDNCYLILVGPGVTKGSELIGGLLKEFRMGDYIYPLGPYSNISDIYRELDIHILASFSEGFPNVVAEAMVHSVPCVVTDVGDAAEIVGDTGWLVVPGDPNTLALALESAATGKLDNLKWQTRRKEARSRIVDFYSLDTMVSKYETLWSFDG